MSLDILVILAGGILAILGAVLVLLMSPARYPSLLASVALASMGLLQLGWARSIYGVVWSLSETWFELSLAFALPVSLSWVLLSRTLGLGPSAGPLGPWRYYIVAQALFAVAAVVWVVVSPSSALLSAVGKPAAFPLDQPAIAMIVAILCNVVLLTASFESTYLSLPKSSRRAFRPGLFGIFLVSGYATYVAVHSLFTGHVLVAELSLGAFPVAALSLLLPLSLIRGRLADLHVRRGKRPLTRTASLTISTGILVAATSLLWITHATGWSVARGVWILCALGAAVGMAALAISNRLQRRALRLIDPYLHRQGMDTRALAERLDETIRPARSVAELCRLIPANTREIAGADPVTLFLADEDEERFIVAGSTLDPAPAVVVLARDPLAAELMRTRQSIQLRGRVDDLDYIPIYVENAAQLLACVAACAAPITRGDQLLGFLLCGEQGSEPKSRRNLLLLLDLVSRRYAAQFEALCGPLRDGDSPAIGDEVEV